MWTQTTTHKITGIMIIVAAFISFAGTFVGIIIPCYLVLFGVLVTIMVFYIPPSLAAMIPFYMNFLGRGLTFLFLGCLVLVELEMKILNLQLL